MATAFGIMQEGKTISLSPTGIIAIDDLRLSICQKFYDASTILIQVEGCHHIFCEGSLHSVIWTPLSSLVRELISNSGWSKTYCRKDLGVCSRVRGRRIRASSAVRVSGRVTGNTNLSSIMREILLTGSVISESQNCFISIILRQLWLDGYRWVQCKQTCGRKWDRLKVEGWEKDMLYFFCMLWCSYYLILGQACLDYVAVVRLLLLGSEKTCSPKNLSMDFCDVDTQNVL